MNKKIIEKLESNINGLTESEVKKRINTYGKNKLQEKKKKTVFQTFIEQINNPLIYILIVGAILSIFLKDINDAIIIFIVILLNSVIGVIQEGKAQKALDALKKLSGLTCIVKRNSKLLEISTEDLVPGDIVVLEAGRQVPADLILLETSNLQIIESTLTGESVPVQKDSEFCSSLDSDKIPIADKLNYAYMSTIVTSGRGLGIVEKTGMNTEIGKIANMLNKEENDITPLQKRLADLSKILGILAIFICVLLFGIAIIQKRDMVEMLITAISLAVAAVPEGLPAIVTVVLALGVQKLVKVNAIVKKLPAVETLGCVNIVCSDKTGTLTQNKMTVTKCFLNNQLIDSDNINVLDNEKFIHGFILCNDSSIDNDRIGDPTETALLDFGLKYNFTKKILNEEYKRIDEKAFDSDRKMMTTLHSYNNSFISYTKGAPDQILKNCNRILLNNKIIELNNDSKKDILNIIEQMSNKALRCLGLAYTENNYISEENMIFVGIIGMIDPERPEVIDAIKIFKDAQIKTVMITGDYKITAFEIAKKLGIADNLNQCLSGDELDDLSEKELNDRINNISVFARVSPEHKVKIVKAFKANGNIVSMTGDGTNDAPALKVADIGVAMGITGTDVAKESADMILCDDSFITIKDAIEEGRSLYQNIKKSVVFLLASNLGEIIAMFITILAGLIVPLKAIHILWINLITDSLPALALGTDINDKKELMKNPPRKSNESLFANGALKNIIFYGFIIGLLTISAFLFIPIKTLIQTNQVINIQNIDSILIDSVLIHSQTYAFVILGLSQLFHAIGTRNFNVSIFKMNHLENKTMIIALFVGIILQICVTEIPFFNNVFGTFSISLMEWFLLLVFSTIPLWFHELFILINKIKKNL